jgi:FADH2 O2-dependent halogenase
MSVGAAHEARGEGDPVENVADSGAETDVAILGSGIAGSTLALILARAGLKVDLIDPVNHPRFALGESTIAATAFWMRLIAERHRVPELHTIASAAAINDRIAPTSGVKKHFGFVYHRPGEARVAHSWQVNIPGSRASLTGESHLFRQDVDAYLYHSALGAGVRGRVEAVNEVEIEEDGVTLIASSGRRSRAALVVDAAGFRSPLAQKLGLREQPSRLKTRSRSVFTHMLGVRPFDEVDVGHGFPKLWHSGTLHHVFEGGWIWVIPFDNHPSSRNPLCSVGLNLDMGRHPRREGVSPEAEWAEVMERYPLIRRQFEGAVAARTWVSTDRLQYSSRATVGDRFLVTAHAAGTIDALYSRGLLNTFQAINVAARLIVDAFRDGEFRRERFEPLERLEQNLLDVHDGLVYGAYAATGDPRLLSVWLALWGLSERLSVLHVLEPFKAYAAGDRSALGFDDAEPESCLRHYPAFRSLLDGCVAIMVRYERGEIDGDAALAALHRSCAASRKHFWIDPAAAFPLGGFSPEQQRLRTRYHSWEGMLIDLGRSLPLPRTGLARYGLEHYGGDAGRAVGFVLRSWQRVKSKVDGPRPEPPAPSQVAAR